MPRGKFKLMIQISPRLGASKAPAAPPSPISSSEDDSSIDSLDALEAEHESLTTMMESLKQQMSSIQAASKQINNQVSGICKKAKHDEELAFDWTSELMTPLKETTEEWLLDHGVSPKPTLKEFMSAVLDSAKSLDLATRTVTFKKEDADILWSGSRRLTIFEILSCLSELFE
jgi:hypothetical protein